MGLTGLSLTQSLSYLQVELHEAGAGLGQVPAGAHHRQAARLTQRLVTEVDVQEGLDCIICLIAKDVVWPQRPGRVKGGWGWERAEKIMTNSLLWNRTLGVCAARTQGQDHSQLETLRIIFVPL